MLYSRSVLAASLVACAGSYASAAIISVSGDFAGSFGNTNVLPINGQSTNTLSGSIAGASFAGIVNAASYNDGCDLLLTFTQFSITSTLNAPVTLTVTITQDYEVPVALWTGSHQLNGDANFTAAGQTASILVTSTHETTNLPTLGQTEVAAGPSVVTLNRGQGPTTVINPISGFYTISTTYTMVLNAMGTGSVTLNLPDSGVDQASCVIPAPSAGLALAGLAGLVGASRRRR